MAHISVKDIHLAYPVLDNPFRRRKVTTAPNAVVGAPLSESSKNSVKVINDLSFELENGDRLAIIGPNGAGKSSLLNILAGIYYPTQGTVDVEGTISAVFNIGLGMRTEATGYRNIELRCLMAGLNKSETQQVIQDVESFSGLGTYLNMPVKLYSRGMALRLNFAMVTAMKANIILMDEWIGAGDKEFRAKVIERMQSFVGSASIVVLASHNLRLLKRICNKALWLDRGEVIAYGSAEDIINQYLGDTPSPSAKA